MTRRKGKTELIDVKELLERDEDFPALIVCLRPWARIEPGLAKGCQAFGLNLSARCGVGDWATRRRSYSSVKYRTRGFCRHEDHR
jgi:hypothetical protein